MPVNDIMCTISEKMIKELNNFFQKVVKLKSSTVYQVFVLVHLNLVKFLMSHEKLKPKEKE